MSDNKLPNSPEDLPWAHSTTNPNWLRNMLVTLNQYSVVEIHWENDWSESNRTGEPAGEWDVTIETRSRKLFSAKHESIENALWYATTLAEHEDSEDYRKRDEARNGALAKLTPDERRILGLS